MDVILLVIFCIQIGNKAKQHGLDARRWRWRLILTWLSLEFFGLFMGVLLFGYDKDNLFGLALFAFACAFGGYLLVKAALNKKVNMETEQHDDML